MKLSIDYQPDAIVNLVCDAEGATFLIDSMEKIKAGGHDHLMTEEWGGWELTPGEVTEPGIVVHQWNIFVIADPSSGPVSEPE